MNDIQFYSVVMFFAGVALTHAVFFWDKKFKEKKFYIFLSAIILQALENIHLAHQASIEFAKEQIKTLEETDAEEYLQKESQKVSVFMELYVLLLVNSIPQSGRKYINYKTWPEAKALIEQMRELMDNGQSKR